MTCRLIKIDETKNQRRFYNMHLVPTLFGDWSLVREWGRLGSAGTLRFDPYPTEQVALDAFDTIKSAKLKRGYSILGPS